MARKKNTDDDDEAREQEEATGADGDRDTGAPEVPDAIGAEPDADGGAPRAPTESELEAQGFTPDEVDRLINICDRLARSEESRDAEAVLRRLRFARWLIERGMLDEWSA